MTEKDLGFEIIYAITDKDYKGWCIVDFKLYKPTIENTILSVALNLYHKKEGSINDLKSDYKEYIKPYFIKVNEWLEKQGVNYSDTIDVIYDVPEENILFWKLKYQ